MSNQRVHAPVYDIVKTSNMLMVERLILHGMVLLLWMYCWGLEWIDTDIFVLLLSCIYVQPTCTCTSIYDIVKTSKYAMVERLIFYGMIQLLWMYCWGLEWIDTNIFVLLLSCIYVQPTCTCTSIYDIVREYQSGHEDIPVGII
jgi:hypothetical protein